MDDDSDASWNGILYFNKEDKRILVRKRHYPLLGYTLNLGHPLSPPILIAIIVFPALIVSLVKRRHG